MKQPSAGNQIATVTNMAVEKLRKYVLMLDRWRLLTNLISERDYAMIWERHIEDSIYIHRVFPAAKRWLDLGSGAGFPGIVLGVLLEDIKESQVHCVESDRRKCSFLRSAVAELQIPVKIHNCRAESDSVAQIGPVDAITARAFASLHQILTLSQRQFAHGASAVLPRGKTYQSEVESLPHGRYNVVVEPTPHSGGGAILIIQRRFDD